jgi:acetyltransferase-like isoleucine patch superfamily enzyme
VVLGPCSVDCRGEMVIGRELVVRSRRWNRVDIFVDHKARLEIGDGVFVNQGVRIACCDRIEIGDGCLIGDETVILDNDFHGALGNTPKIGPVRIGHHVWIATRVIVLRGVTIGEGSVIGAGSIVTQSIPPRSFAAGVPARVLKSLQ